MDEAKDRVQRGASFTADTVHCTHFTPDTVHGTHFTPDTEDEAGYTPLQLCRNYHQRQWQQARPGPRLPSVYTAVPRSHPRSRPTHQTMPFPTVLFGHVPTAAPPPDQSPSRCRPVGSLRSRPALPPAPTLRPEGIILSLRPSSLAIFRSLSLSPSPSLPLPLHSDPPRPLPLILSLCLSLCLSLSPSPFLRLSLSSLRLPLPAPLPLLSPTSHSSTRLPPPSSLPRALLRPLTPDHQAPMVPHRPPPPSSRLSPLPSPRSAWRCSSATGGSCGPWRTRTTCQRTTGSLATAGRTRTRCLREGRGEGV